MAGLTKILFKMAGSVDTSLHPYLFEGNYLVLQVKPADYRKTSEDSYQVHRGFAASAIEITPTPYSFEAKTEQGAEVIGEVLQAIVDDATSDPLKYKLVECVDRHVPGAPVTRFGVLQFQPIAGAVNGVRGKQQTEGYRVFFQEV
jgi:hypothetical protein